MGLRDWIEIRFWRFAILILKKGYGADCRDFDNECPSCRAKRTIDWIYDHIKLIEL